MKKYILALLLFLLFIPIMVLAEDSDKISVSSIIIEEKTNNVLEIDDPSASNISLSMEEVGDKIKYKITIKNDSDDDYEFDKDSFNISSDYIDYVFELEDDSYIISAKSSKILYLTVKYINQIPDNIFSNGVYNDNVSISLTLISKEKVIVIDNVVDNNSNEEEPIIENKIINISNSINNPETEDIAIGLLIVIMIVSLITCIIFRKKINKMLKILIIGIIIAIPISAYAIYKCNLDIKINVRIKQPVPLNDYIYWALQDNNSDNINETLVIADHEVNGKLKGSFEGDTVFEDYWDIPWIANEFEDENNLSYNVNNIVIDGEVAPKSTAYWFSGVGYNSNEMTTNLGDLITDNVTNMAFMFMAFGSNVDNLSLDLNSWDTLKVTNMSNLFLGFGNNSNNIDLKIDKWNTIDVTDMSFMFNNFASHTNNVVIDISNFNTRNVKNMRAMFLNTGYFSNSISLNLGSFNTSKVTEMNSLFSNFGYNASSCSISDISGLDTSKVTSMNSLFSRTCYSANKFKIDISKWNVRNVTDFKYFLYDSGYNATNWEVGNLSKWDTSKVTNMEYMFDSAGHNSTVWDIGDISKWNTSNVTSMANTFNNVAVNVNKFELDLANWNTSKVTNMYRMFHGLCNKSVECSLKNISNFDTSNVTNMKETFKGVAFVADTFKLDISNWNMSKVDNLTDFVAATGYSATNWEIIIPKNNGNGIDNLETVLYGKNTSVKYDSSHLREGRLFTLAS